MTATDPAVQAVAEAMHADLCPDDECDGSDMGEWDRQAEVAVAAAMPLIAAEALREAADGWTQGHWADDLPTRGANRPQLILGMAQRAGDWLRDRADDLEAGR